jgi:hypothetical protein
MDELIKDLKVSLEDMMETVGGMYAKHMPGNEDRCQFCNSKMYPHAIYIYECPYPDCVGNVAYAAVDRARQHLGGN